MCINIRYLLKIKCPLNFVKNSYNKNINNKWFKTKQKFTKTRLIPIKFLYIIPIQVTALKKVCSWLYLKIIIQGTSQFFEVECPSAVKNSI